MMANYKKTKWRGIELEPGQLVTSRSELAEKTGLSERQIRTVLCKLQATSNLTIKTTSHFSLITIANWAKFQDVSEEAASETTSEASLERPQLNKLRKEEYIISSSEQPAGGSGKEEKTKKFDHESKPYKCAVFLDAKIQKLLPKKKPSDERGLQNWAIHFDRLNRLDEQSWEDIAEVLQFSQRDSFWQTHILSGASFREKYWKLVAKMKSGVMQ